MSDDEMNFDMNSYLAPIKYYEIYGRAEKVIFACGDLLMKQKVNCGLAHRICNRFSKRAFK